MSRLFVFFPQQAFSSWLLASSSTLARASAARAKSSKLRAKSLLLRDKFGRGITDLRISITDRCNYKCVYCRTGNEGALYGDLPFEDYLRMARVLVGMGISKVRVTGGEPLLRKGVVEFVRELAKLRPQGLKPASLSRGNGTAKAVPFPNPKAPFAAGSLPNTEAGLGVVSLSKPE